jgi:hypothetical protein
MQLRKCPRALSTSDCREYLCQHIFSLFWFPAFHEPFPRYTAFRAYAKITRSYFTGNYTPRFFAQDYIKLHHPRFLVIRYSR